MRSHCCHRTMLTMWCHYDVSMISKLWHHMYELLVRSQWHELTTSPWGHSVVTVWCHRYTRWPHHHEVTVLSQDDAHSVMSSWHHYDITIKSSYVWVLCDVTVILAWYHVLTGFSLGPLPSMSLKAGTLAVYWYLNPLTAGAEYIGWPPFFQIWIIFTHLKLWIGSARHNFK